MRVRFEFLMTNSIFTFLSHLTQGTEYTYTKDIFINGDSITLGFPDYLNGILSSNNINEEILKFQPNDPKYIALQVEMENIVMNMVTSDNTIIVPDMESDSYSNYNLFSYLFKINGITDSETTITDPQIFTSMLKEFQSIIGLRASGKIDNATRKAVSIIIKLRYEDIAYSLEKIRQGNNYNKN